MAPPRDRHGSAAWVAWPIATSGQKRQDGCVPEGAAAAYESLLADCYDQLHRFSKSVNGISSTSPHKSPAASIAALGAAYRASARTLPIFDTYGHDAYPEVS